MAVDSVEALQKRSNRITIAVTIGLVAVIAVLALTLLTSTNPSTKASSFRLPRLGGGPTVTYPLAKPDNNSAVVLTVFASWCPDCQTELPSVAKEVDALEKAHTRVQFIGIDGNDSASSGMAFAKKSGVTFTVAADQNEEVARDYALPGLPGTIFINASGTVAHVVQGKVSPSQFRYWVNKIS